MKKEIEKMLELSKLINFDERCDGFWYRGNLSWCRCNSADCRVWDGISYFAEVYKGKVVSICKVSRLSF